jgi:general secretion pathway protein N
MKRACAVGIALLLLAIIVQFPAAWLAPVIGRMTSERWRLTDIEGTLWSGRAKLYVFDRPTGYWYRGHAMTWRVLWRKLATGVLAAGVGFDDGGRAEITAGARGWTIEGADATFPARQLAVLLPGTIGEYGWGGTIVVRAAAFRCSWGRPTCTGQAELVWGGAATTQIPGSLLGDYRVRVIAEGDALRFTVSTIQGRLQAAGAGEISGGPLRFAGEAYAGGGDLRLESILRAIGRPGSVPGRYLIDYRERSSDR